MRLTSYALVTGVQTVALPILPRPIAASYLREGPFYRASILMERLLDVRSLADMAAVDGHSAPWDETGRLVARFHRAGLDHVDLHAHNLLFDAECQGWQIGRAAWRERVGKVV